MDIIDELERLKEAVNIRNNFDKIPELICIMLSQEIDRLSVCDKDQFDKVQGGVNQLRELLEIITGTRGKINVTI